MDIDIYSDDYSLINIENICNFTKMRCDIYIDKIWKEHQENKVDWSHQLWTILMFQSWLNDNKK